MINGEVYIIMKLVLLIANDEFIDEITSALIQNGFTATEVASTGEFVKYGDTILLLGVEDGLENEVVETLKNASHHSRGKELPFFGKVSIYIISLDEYAKIIGREPCEKQVS